MSWIGKDVCKFFPTHGTFKGKVQQYHYASDNYTITCEDNDVERVTYSNMKHVVPGTPDYANNQSIVRALHVDFTAAVTDAASTFPSVGESETFTFRPCSAFWILIQYGREGHPVLSQLFDWQRCIYPRDRYCTRSVRSTQPAASHHSPRVGNCLTVAHPRHGVATPHRVVQLCQIN